MADAKDVARLRAETGAGVMDSKRALDETKGDFAKAKELLKARGLEKAASKADREAKDGLIEAYTHSGGRVGALVELTSETDFVARGESFRELARELAMQVAAMEPATVEELLKQDYIRDSSKKIGELVATLAATTGENVQVRRFVRFKLGEAA